MWRKFSSWIFPIIIDMILPKTDIININHPSLINPNTNSIINKIKEIFISIVSILNNGLYIFFNKYSSCI